MRTNLAALRYTANTRKRAIESITAELLAYCRRRSEAREKKGER